MFHAGASFLYRNIASHPSELKNTDSHSIRFLTNTGRKMCIVNDIFFTFNFSGYQIPIDKNLQRKSKYNAIVLYQRHFRVEAHLLRYFYIFTHLTSVFLLIKFK